MLDRALYIQSDLRKDTENWFSALQKALAVSNLTAIYRFYFVSFKFCWLVLVKTCNYTPLEESKTAQQGSVG